VAKERGGKAYAEQVRCATAAEIAAARAARPAAAPKDPLLALCDGDFAFAETVRALARRVEAAREGGAAPAAGHAVSGALPPPRSSGGAHARQPRRGAARHNKPKPKPKPKPKQQQGQKQGRKQQQQQQQQQQVKPRRRRAQRTEPGGGERGDRAPAFTATAPSPPLPYSGLVPSHLLVRQQNLSGGTGRRE
jgi:hypothetical protein